MAMTDYIWDVENDSYLMETNENGDTVAEYTNEPGQYGPLVSERRSGQSYFQQYDGEGNTRAATDASGDVVETATYRAFGEEVAKSSIITNPFGYKAALGYYTNGAFDGQYVRARHYLAGLGRWSTVDPTRIEFGPNFYAYVMNDPINRADPSGLVPLCRAIISFVPHTRPFFSLSPTIEPSWHEWKIENNTGGDYGLTRAYPFVKCWCRVNCTQLATTESAIDAHATYELECRVRLLTVITLNEKLIASRGVLKSGVYGHEQRHVRCVRKHVVSYLNSLRCRPFRHRSTCMATIRDAQETIEGRILHMIDRDRRHGLCTHPLRRRDYSPIGGMPFRPVGVHR